MKKTISIVLVLVLGLASVSLALEDTWTQKADMPTARFVTSSGVVDGKIYVIGGQQGKGMACIKTVEEYDPATDTWTRKGNMPMVRGAAASSVVNGRIYVIGGQTYLFDAPYSSVEEYDATTDTWTAKANMPTARSLLSSSVVNGKIYAIGGALTYEGTTLSRVEEYDPATDTWTRKADMPTARACLSTSAANGKIYAIGGTLGSSQWYQALSTVEEYDPATDTWTTKADMPTPRTYFSTCAVNDKIYVIGGLTTGAGDHVFSVEEYDPATDTWTRKADIPNARSGLVTCAVNDKMYAIGGWADGNWTGISTVEEYDTGLTAEEWPLAGTWFGTNSHGHAIVFNITPLGPDNDLFVGAVDIAHDPSFGGLFPGTIAATNMRGMYVKTRLNTYDFTIMSYGLAEPAEGESARQVVYIQVVSGQFILTDENTLASDLYTAALYAPDQDPFGYEPPAYGCYPVSGTYKRMPVVPVCELPLPEPMEE